jgi:hypothetical protein
VKDRTLKKRAARKDRSIRRDLVHAAGCTEPDCATKFYRVPEILEMVRNAEGDRHVSVPRSLRGVIGRWL